MDGDGLSALDVAALALLAAAALRGLWIGMIRETFSLGSLLAACVAVRLFLTPVGDWLEHSSPISLGPGAADVAAAALLALGAVALVGTAGAILRRGARAVGLGLLDRLAGGVLGAAEGALVVLVGFVLAGAVLGRDHPELTGSHLYASFDQLRPAATGTTDVAAPPPTSD